MEVEPVAARPEADATGVPAAAPAEMAVVLHLGERRVCLLRDHVTEVLPLGSDLVPLPGAPGAVVGLVPVRGIIVTILDTGRLLGLGPTEPRYAALAKLDGELIGLTSSALPTLATVGPPVAAGGHPGLPEIRLDARHEPVGIVDVAALVRAGMPR